jgi:hypothetical protein
VGLAHKLVKEAVCPRADCNLTLAAASEPEYADSMDDRACSYAGVEVPMIPAEALVY